MFKSNNKLLLIAMILFAMMLIPLGDSAGKLMMQSGVAPIFVAWSRLLLGAIILLPLSGLQVSELRSLFDWRVLLRAGLFICAITSILRAVETEAIANVFGGFFIGPIISYFLAALLLKENITVTRSILLLIGFGGALMVIKPGFGMTSGMGFAVLAGIFYGMLLVANRWLSGIFRPRLILISTLIVGSIVVAPFGIDNIPADIDFRIAMLLLLSAMTSAFGNLIIIEVSKQLPTSIVAPFVYMQLVAATFFGVVIFGTWPDALSLMGLLVLVVSGIASFFLANLKFKH